MKITYFTIYLMIIILSSIMIFNINLFLSLILIIIAVISFIFKIKHDWKCEKIILNDLQYVEERTEKLRSKKFNINDLDELLILQEMLEKCRKYFIGVHDSTTIQINYYDDIIFNMIQTIKKTNEYNRSQKLKQLLK